MEEVKKESMGDGDKDNGGEMKDQKFCILCSKYTKDELKLVQIGSIPIGPKQVIAVTVDTCPKCLIIINNAARVYREAIAAFREQQEEAMKKLAEVQKGGLVDAHGNKIAGDPGSNIAVPKLMLGKNFLKKIKGGKA